MNFKRSHYLVTTDPEPAIANKRILLATRTSRTATLSERLYDTLQREAWHEMADDDFQKLRQIEAIVPGEENELQTIIDRNNRTIRDNKTLYQVIQPTAMCQLGCGYCGQKHTKDYLPTSASDAILERIKSKFTAKDYKSLSVAWFGSEPLLGLVQIRELTPKLKAMAKEQGCTYWAKTVTNGLSLKEPIFLELVQKHSIKKIEITLDGTAAFHDARRHTKEGLPTFNLIFQNLLKILNRPDFKELGCSISLRCNVDERNSESVVPLIQLLAEHNLQDKIEYFYVAPIHSWGNDAHLLSLEKQAFADKEIGWLIEQMRYGFRPGLMPSLAPIVCMSVQPDAEVFDAFGNVFDCTEVPYVDNYKDSEYVLGNINNGSSSIAKRRPLLGFYDEVAQGQYPCTKCPMLPVCGGGCPKSWREGVAPCPTNKFNIKDKLLLYYALSKKESRERLKAALAEPVA